MKPIMLCAGSCAAYLYSWFPAAIRTLLLVHSVCCESDDWSVDAWSQLPQHSIGAINLPCACMLVAAGFCALPKRRFEETISLTLKSAGAANKQLRTASVIAASSELVSLQH
jgi:hypothetical protein